MRPDCYWITLPNHRLAIMPRPRAGDWLTDEVRAWSDSGIALVVSLLEPAEVDDLELSEQPGLCHQFGIEFRSFPIPDRGVPDQAKLLELVLDLYDHLQQGQAVAIHCRAGIGRTGLVAGCLLHFIGIPVRDIFPLLSRCRGVAMPDTPAQAAWVERFCRDHRPRGM